MLVDRMNRLYPDEVQTHMGQASEYGEPDTVSEEGEEGDELGQ